MIRTTCLAALLLLLASCHGPTAPSRRATPQPNAADSAVLLEELSGRAVFPTDNWWNLDVSHAPVDANSAAYVDWLSGRSAQNPASVRHAHPDFGPPPYGIPYLTVGGTAALRRVDFSPYADQSDAGASGRPAGYPIPDAAISQDGWIEGGVAGGGSSGDRHLLVIDRDHWLLFETWATHYDAASGAWQAGSGAVFDLSSNARRPDGWTSADAAGLAVFPGLVRYDEVSSGSPIHHAFRVTVRATNGYVWPASHAAGNTSAAPPMGARLRLKAAKDLGAYPADVQRIFQAMKTYGLIVADNGSDLYVSGTMDARWNNDVLNPAFASLTADDFEVVHLGWGEPTSGVRARRASSAPAATRSP